MTATTETGRPARLALAPVAISANPPLPPSLTLAGRRSWQQRYVRRLLVGDATVLACTTAAAAAFRSGNPMSTLHGFSYAAVAATVTVSWLLSLGAARAYEPRFLGCGSEEYKRITTAAGHLVAALAVLALALRLDIARSFVVLALALGTGALLVHRFAARRVLYRSRERGRDVHRVVVVGDAQAAAALTAAVRREPRAGFHVVGVCLPRSRASLDVAGGEPVPVLGSFDSVVTAARAAQADTIAVTAGPSIDSERLRQLSWQLEGAGVDLIVAPALTDVAGPRVSIRPVAGLPLLHVDQPDITGVRYLLKELVERAIAATVLLLALPLLLVLAVAVKASSPGPVLFSQMRVTRHGREFRIMKFRSMRVDAESLLEELRTHNDVDGGPLFKMRVDPRVTRVGRLLRRWSLDELPQLLNVIRGDMALVGPRPPLPTEVAGYTAGVRRRLLVKPGMTGLWQVSGRSDLSWEESVRLDLYYVENWSLALDAQIIMRTMRVVLRGRGAY